MLLQDIASHRLSVPQAAARAGELAYAALCFPYADLLLYALLHSDRATHGPHRLPNGQQLYAARDGHLLTLTLTDPTAQLTVDPAAQTVIATQGYPLQAQTPQILETDAGEALTHLLTEITSQALHTWPSGGWIQ